MNGSADPCAARLCRTCSSHRPKMSRTAHSPWKPCGVVIVQGFRGNFAKLWPPTVLTCGGQPPGTALLHENSAKTPFCRMHLVPWPLKIGDQPRIDLQKSCRSASSRTGRQPHRRRRSGRASRERGQGTGGKRHRRRRQPDRRLHRWRRQAADRHHRRWRRHDVGRSRAFGGSACDVKAGRRGSAAHPHAGISRRGAALDRAGGGLTRLGDILGGDFRGSAIEVRSEREGVVVEGFAAAPSLTRANALGQYLFVNGRPVRDKLILGAVRAAYSDYLPRDRHPVVALFVTLDPEGVDANVHPAKPEARFRSAGLVRALIVHALKDGLAREGKRTAANSDGAAISSFRPSFAPPRANWDWRRSPAFPTGPLPAFDGSAAAAFAQPGQAAFDVGTPAADVRFQETSSPDLLDRPLGAARTQIHETYIVSQTRDGLIVVDQHAAHERIVYEKLKESLARNGVQRQILLIPEIVELDEATVERLVARAAELASFGLAIDSFGPGAVAVPETPSLLGKANAAGLLRDLAEHMAEWDEALPLERRLMHAPATTPCPPPLRAGRRLKPEEMNALLREMEDTPNSGQCNHGRPTYVELKLADIEKLFGRR